MIGWNYGFAGMTGTGGWTSFFYRIHGVLIDLILVGMWLGKQIKKNK